MMVDISNGPTPSRQRNGLTRMTHEALGLFFRVVTAGSCDPTTKEIPMDIDLQPQLSGQRYDLLVAMDAPGDNPPELVVTWVASQPQELPTPYRFRLAHTQSEIQIIGPVVRPGVDYTATVTSPGHDPLISTFSRT